MDEFTVVYECKKKIKTPFSPDNVWTSRGRDIENNNYTISSKINSTNIQKLELVKTIPVPLCDAWSMPSADEDFYYFSTLGTYLNPTYNENNELTSSINGSGNVLKINRKTLEVAQQVPFSVMTGATIDACRTTPVIFEDYLYLASSRIGQNGTMVCVNKHDMTKVIWRTQLTPKSSAGFAGANAIVVDLRTLPDPEAIIRSQLPRQNNENILYQRKRMIKEHPVVLYVGTTSLEELNVPTPIDRPLQNGNVVCLDAFTGEILWKKAMLPQQYIEGDLLDNDSLRYNSTTGFLVDYADCHVPAVAGTKLIRYINGIQKKKNEIRLYANSKTTLFFKLGAKNSALPAYVVGKTILITRTDNSSVEVTFDPVAYGSVVKNADKYASGQIMDYDLTGQTTIPSDIDGCFILEPLYPRDIMTMAEASSMNYTGCSVWGNPIVFDSTRWQLSISTGNNYSVPFDETNWVQGGLTNQLTSQLSVLNDKYLQDIATSASAEIIADDLLAIENLQKQQSFLSKFICKRGQQNIFNGISSIEAVTGEITWSFKTKIYDVWTGSAWFLNNSSIVNGSPWGDDSDFGMASHIYRDPSGDPNNDLYVNISKGSVLVSLYANSGKVKHTSVVGTADVLGGSNYSSASDGKYLYAVIINRTSGISSFTVTLNGNPEQTVTFPYEQSYVIKYDPFTGNVLWASAMGDAAGKYTLSQPLVSNNILYVPDFNGYMRTFNISDGSVVENPFGELPFAGFFPPLILKDTLFMSGGMHYVMKYFSDASYYKPCSSIQIYKLP